ncbi:MAG: phosphotransferase [Clostridia bacterium]|nr:phosphotransferase [Clostridia bacterium]
MKNIIEHILSLWEIKHNQLLQIAPSVWEINNSYILKIFDKKTRLAKNIKIIEILSEFGIPVANIVYTKTGETYVEYNNNYFLMTKKLQGNNLSYINDKTIAQKIGCAIAKLHIAFIKCEKEFDFPDNCLLREMKGWILETLTNNEWKIISKDEYLKTVELLENTYNFLPKQLIHRDIHLGNFLFLEDNLSGFLDFDLSQKSIRIFDVCYFLSSLLSAKTEEPFSENEWLENVKHVIAGYESINSLSAKEKDAIPCVMECTEILLAAYYIKKEDTKRANIAYNEFQFIKNCETDIKNAINQNVP